LAATRFERFFALTRRFYEVLDLALFFAFFMISPFRFDLVQIGLPSYCWSSGRDGFRTSEPKRSLVASFFANRLLGKLSRLHPSASRASLVHVRAMSSRMSRTRGLEARSANH